MRSNLSHTRARAYHRHNSSVTNYSNPEMSYKTSLYINGKWVEPVKGGKFTTYNPATGKLILCM